MPVANCEKCGQPFQESDPDTLEQDVMKHINLRHEQWWDQLSASQRAELLKTVRDENHPGNFLGI